MLMYYADNTKNDIDIVELDWNGCLLTVLEKSMKTNVHI